MFRIKKKLLKKEDKLNLVYRMDGVGKVLNEKKELCEKLKQYDESLPKMRE